MAGVRRVLSACFLYSFLFSTAVALLVWFCAPLVAEAWIGDLRTLAALRIFAAFLPVVCLGGVMTDTSPQPGGFGSWWRWKFWSKWFLWR